MSQTLASKKTAVAKKDNKPVRKESNRDLVEQLVVALILACLIRGFEAEAFVIPTGSMAPTLMGRHKEVTCRQCKKVYPVNAADEVEGRDSRIRVVAGTCPNCHYQDKIDELPSFKGDRILVMKFLYSLPFLPGGGGPKRWEVVVFKYPEDPEVNYIKRLVGMPNEEVRVYFGDILTRLLGSKEPFHFERRPLEHQSAMQMLVWDDAYRPKAMDGMPEWARWRSKTQGAWVEEQPGTYVADGKASGWAELRYSHLVPDPRQWEEILGGQTPSTPPRPTLINDYYAYNSNISGSRGSEWGDSYPGHWVGDLTLSGRLEATTPTGIIRLELVEGGVANRCEIDVATGMAFTTATGSWVLRPRADSRARGPMTWRSRTWTIA
jgi:signal peptidase I